MQLNVTGRLLPKFLIYFVFILESNEEHIPMASLVNVLFCLFVCLFACLLACLLACVCVFFVGFFLFFVFFSEWNQGSR